MVVFRSVRQHTILRGKSQKICSRHGKAGRLRAVAAEQKTTLVRAIGRWSLAALVLELRGAIEERGQEEAIQKTSDPDGYAFVADAFEDFLLRFLAKSFQCRHRARLARRLQFRNRVNAEFRLQRADFLRPDAGNLEQLDETGRNRRDRKSVV